jgi:hypothetical protein
VAVGLGVAALAVLAWVPARAATFAALVETAFDLYRQDLYVQLRWPLPATPHDECKEGRRVTTYLLRGSDADTLMFTSAQTAREVTQQGTEAGKGAPKADSASQRDSLPSAMSAHSATTVIAKPAGLAGAAYTSGCQKSGTWTRAELGPARAG